MRIRDAGQAEMTEVGEVRIAAYEAGGFIVAGSGYAPTLRGLGADGTGHVLVATLPASADNAGGESPGGAERIIGTIMLQRWPHAGEIVTGPDEAEIRGLAVLPEAQGQGVGRELLRHLLDRAAGLGVRHLLLYTEHEMRAAHRLYERAGFVRLPERDWFPGPEVVLLAYGLRLNDAARPA